MQTVLAMLARYNRVVNRKLYDLLQTVPAQVLHGNSGSYFSSLFGILNHLLRSDLLWLNRFRPVFPKISCLHESVVGARSVEPSP